MRFKQLDANFFIRIFVAFCAAFIFGILFTNSLNNVKLFFLVFLGLLFFPFIFIKSANFNFILFLIVLFLSAFVMPYRGIDLITLFAFLIFITRIHVLKVTAQVPRWINFFLGCFVFTTIFSFFAMSINSQILENARWEGAVTYINLLLSIFMFYYTVHVVDNFNKFKYIIYIFSSIILINFVLLISYFYFPAVFGKLPAFFKYSISPDPSSYMKVVERRFWGTFKDYELFAEYLAVNFFMFLAYLTARKAKYLNAFVLLMIPVLLFSFVWTKTRGPLFASVIAVLIFSPSLLRIKKKYLAGLILTVVVAIILGLKFFPNFFDRYVQLVFKTEFRGVVPDTRQYVWNAVWQHFQANKGTLFLGRGPAHLSFAYFPSPYPHSLYIDILLRHGILALASFFLFLAAYLIHNRKVSITLFRLRNGYFTFFVLLNLSVWVLLIDEMKIECTRSPNYEMFFWIYLGIIFAIGKLLIHLNEKIRM